MPNDSVAVKLSVHQRAKLMDLIAQEFERRGRELFSAIEELERDDTGSARAMSTAGTVLAPAVEYLNASGYPTESTVGGVMDTLQITQPEAHDLACYCLGPTLNGQAAAERWRDLSERIFIDQMQ